MESIGEIFGLFSNDGKEMEITELVTEFQSPMEGRRSFGVELTMKTSVRS